MKSPGYDHRRTAGSAVLLVNLGTPEAPTPRALRRYLGEFLADPRIVETPRWLWWLILHGIILRIRPRRSARAYAKVWTERGSPLMAFSRDLSDKLASNLTLAEQAPVKVALAMRYGEPSISNVLRELRGAGIRRLLVIPMYPQYSATTTASVYDAVVDELRGWRWLPELRWVADYFEHPPWISAVADSIRDYWREHGQAERLLFSFHGIPKRYLINGDPYHCQCHASARLIASELGLDDSQWQLTFQSRFGREEWLRPYTDKTLEALPAQGIRNVQLVCPGFAVDCLETLEENAMENREIFLHAGGESFGYIPALNDSDAHVQALATLVRRHSAGWPEFSADWDASAESEHRQAQDKKAKRIAAELGYE